MSTVENDARDAIREFVDAGMRSEPTRFVGRFVGQRSPDEFSNGTFKPGDIALVTGIPYDCDRDCPGVAEIGSSSIAVCNGDTVIYNDGTWIHVRESPFVEKTVGTVPDEYGNPIYLPHPVPVRVSRFDKEPDTTVLCQVIRSLLSDIEAS